MPHRGRLGVGHALLIGGAFAALVIAWRDALAWDAPAEPFAAHLGHGWLLLALRAWLLCGAIWGAQHGGWSARATTVFAIVASCFLATLVARGLLVPLTGVSLVALTRLDLPTLPARPAVAALVVACAAAVSIRAMAKPAPQPPPVNVAGETVRWLRQDNPYRARLWARRWVGLEGDDPGEGALILARIDWGIGMPDRARATLIDVVRRSKRPAMREEAQRMLARVDAGSDPGVEGGNH